MWQPPIKGKFLKKKLPPVRNVFGEIDDVKNKIGDIYKTFDNKINQITKEFYDTKEELVTVVDEKLQEVDEIIDEVKQIEPEKGEDGEKGERGDKGDKGEDGKDIDEEEIIEKVLSKIEIPKVDEKVIIKNIISKLPSKKGDLKIIRENVEIDPMGVIDKIMELSEKGKFKLKTNNIDGLEQTISAFRNQLSKGYLHGGGGTTSPLTTKGDIWGYSTTNARIPIGTDGQVLVANSTETLGVKWTDLGVIDTYKVKVSANDTTPNYLYSKLSAGTNISLSIVNPSANEDVQISVSNAALTKVDDTNVTLTLGGSPTTALLQATSLTLGWTGQLSLARGGTGANLSDPGANVLLGWDDTDNSTVFITLGTGLSYDHATHTLSSPDAGGTVTSVAMTVPTGLTISGSPITTSGTLAVALDTGYVIPLQSTLDGYAVKALSNLASVAINTTLVSDTDATDDLGTTLKRWNNIYGVNLGATGTRFTTGWFTDLTVTNAISGSITGNAATATALQNARTIGGVSFDGTANITVASATGGFTVSGGALSIGAGSVGTPALNFSADTDNGLYYLGTDNYGFSVGGGKVLDLATTGLSITGGLNISGLTASKVVFTDASKNLTSTGIGTSSQFIKGDGSLDSNTYLTGNQTITLSGDITGSGSTAITTTLATVNANVGTFGSATQSPQFTVNAKGLITAVSNVTVTPAVGSITGLGTGVATALAVNVGSAGAFVTFNGALGTPSSGTVTNLTGTASININGTVGATTPTTGAFTTLSASSTLTASTTIELGHATDTTLSRSSAGVLAVEGVAIPKGTGTTNEIAYWSGTNTIGTLTTATYPSLTELSYVKGVTSAIQTQLGNKQPLDTQLTSLAGLSYTGNALKVIRVNAGETDFELASAGGAPTDATYVTLSTNATLTNERVLTGTSNQITITDNGAGSTVVLSLPQDIATTSSVQFGKIGINQAVATIARWSLTGTQTGGAPSLTAGAFWQIPDATYTNNVTAGGGNAGDFGFLTIGQPTIDGNETTYSQQVATLYLKGQPLDTTASGRYQILNPYTFWIASGVSRFDGKVVIGGSTITSTTRTWTYNLSFNDDADKTIGIEATTTAATGGRYLSLYAGDAVSGGTNKLGGVLRHYGGRSTGNVVSAIEFYTSTAGASGTSYNTQTKKLDITGNTMTVAAASQFNGAVTIGSTGWGIDTNIYAQTSAGKGLWVLYSSTYKTFYSEKGITTYSNDFEFRTTVLQKDIIFYPYDTEVLRLYGNSQAFKFTASGWVSGSLGIGTGTFGTSAANNFAIANGNVGAAVANQIQLVSEDLSAGNTILSMRTEGSGVTGAGITSVTVTTKVAVKVNGTVYYLLATTNGT